jgi:hypothetical protein
LRLSKVNSLEAEWVCIAYLYAHWHNVSSHGGLFPVEMLLRQSWSKEFWSLLIFLEATLLFKDLFSQIPSHRKSLRE